nr:MAG TPA: hypothetical protein [Caudoviricetes sp.]
MILRFLKFYLILIINYVKSFQHFHRMKLIIEHFTK